jgi:hypothetical protein
MNYEQVASGYALLKKGLSSAVTVAASSIKQAKEVVTEVRHRPSLLPRATDAGAPSSRHAPASARTQRRVACHSPRPWC